jgi:hypothetical protein
VDRAQGKTASIGTQVAVRLRACNAGSEFNGQKRSVLAACSYHAEIGAWVLSSRPTTTKEREGTWYVHIRLGNQDEYVCLKIFPRLGRGSRLMPNVKQVHTREAVAQVKVGAAGGGDGYWNARPRILYGPSREYSKVRRRKLDAKKVTDIGRVGRRRWSEAEKEAFIGEALQPGGNVSAVARRHGIKPSLLFRWRKMAQKET